jgi:hypothetical protein
MQEGIQWALKCYDTDVMKEENNFYTKIKSIVAPRDLWKGSYMIHTNISQCEEKFPHHC